MGSYQIRKHGRCVHRGYRCVRWQRGDRCWSFVALWCVSSQGLRPFGAINSIMTDDKRLNGRADRAAEAVYLHYVEGLTQQAIAEELGVAQSTVSDDINSAPGEEVRKELQQQATQTRLLAWETLKRQLQTAHNRAASATDVEAEWGEEVQSSTIHDDDGQIVDVVPIPQGHSVEPDHDARADARKEVRAIIDAMRTVTGAAETTIDIQSDPSGGGVEITHSWLDADDTPIEGEGREGDDEQ